MLETLDKKLLDVKFITTNWSVSSQCQLTQELTESLQVQFNLTDSTGSSTNFISNFVELNLIDQEASLEDFRGDMDGSSDCIWVTNISD